MSKYRKVNRRGVLATALAGLLTMGLGAAAHAQTYPDKPIRIVVPFPPGGAADTLARALAQQLNDALGKQVIVENKAGAGGTIGTTAVARAEPDGYTLLLGNVSTLAIAPSLYPNLNYDPVKDFQPVTLVGKSPLVFAINPALPAKNLPELIALASREPGKLTFGSSGAGSITHLTGEVLNLATRGNLVHVPYKGSSPVLLAVASGELSMGVTQVVEMLPQYKAGRVGAAAVTGLEKSPALPDVTTARSQGVNGLEATTWYSLMAPAGVSASVIDRLQPALQKVLANPDLRKRFADEGLILAGSTPAELGTFLRGEVQDWAAVIKQAGVKLD
ncbi:Bug family tripartite tricarboxylate transporter substrate binding protein [Achromobacter deleyi]|uniref:Bug family tripartite tricarboxylate transporter substrate binding protein n=1 Tax=Achromobacter deleyi TaxID=1353891 RepID=UPI001493237C|nr:tripartite tricarboxylate transporter substrate binding protein [Achromobacter deleyi]QVQ28198.1 tripartite tricarboxylate transporter substrate binding protein [Achromobacter deleyi]UIP18390.1 tripartite tricarboxylate transporter substrate binding protein [Achromobacter deleyi]